MTKGTFVQPDQVRMIDESYDYGFLKRPQVKVVLTVRTSPKCRMVTIRQRHPVRKPYAVTGDSGRFTFSQPFMPDQLLEVSDGEGHRIVLFTDSIATDIDLAQMTLHGSPLNERFADCQRRLRALEHEIHKYANVEEVGSNIIIDEAGFRRLAEDAHQLQMQFIDENRENMIPAWYIADNYTTMTADELARCLQKGRACSDHVALQPAKEWYEGLQKRQPGQQFRDVACIDTAGVRHQLSDYIGRGDYVVLNFWATWQILTRSSCKLMKQMAKQHAGKNLRVIGFALDTDRHDWRQYVKARLLEYEHLSSAAPSAGHDQHPWSSPVAPSAYGIHALPETIVFAPDGRIVCTGLAGEALRAKVNSLPLKRK